MQREWIKDSILGLLTHCDMCNKRYTKKEFLLGKEITIKNNNFWICRDCFHKLAVEKEYVRCCICNQLQADTDWFGTLKYKKEQMFVCRECDKNLEDNFYE